MIKIERDSGMCRVYAEGEIHVVEVVADGECRREAFKTEEKAQAWVRTNLIKR